MLRAELISEEVSPHPKLTSSFSWELLVEDRNQISEFQYWSPNMSMSTMKRLMYDLKELAQNPLVGVFARPGKL